MDDFSQPQKFTPREIFPAKETWRSPKLVSRNIIWTKPLSYLGVQTVTFQACTSIFSFEKILFGKSIYLGAISSWQGFCWWGFQGRFFFWNPPTIAFWQLALFLRWLFLLLSNWQLVSPKKLLIFLGIFFRPDSDFQENHVQTVPRNWLQLTSQGVLLCLFVVYCNFGIEELIFRKWNPFISGLIQGWWKNVVAILSSIRVRCYLRGVLTATADVSLVEDKEFLLSPPLETWPLDLKRGGTVGGELHGYSQPTQP